MMRLLRRKKAASLMELMVRTEAPVRMVSHLMLEVTETGSSEIMTLVFLQLVLLVIKAYPVRPVKTVRMAYLQPIAGMALYYPSLPQVVLLPLI